MKFTAFAITIMTLLAATIVGSEPPIPDSNRAREVFAKNAGHLMGPTEFQALPSKPADHHIIYGEDPNQFGDLRVPTEDGLHPVAILIHGGCWKSDFATLRDLAPMADALKEKGVATWNIEYRRLAQDGSGWPGTYMDVGRGVDYLRSIAEHYNLDLKRVIVVGHSAGGHLAMWVASRLRLPKTSALSVNDPLPIRGVVNLAGTGDMEAYIQVEQRACGDTVVEKMLGGKPAEVPERYVQASAIKMLPLRIPQVLIWGQGDNYVPIWLGEHYIQAGKLAGDSVRLVSFPDIGHFEIASPLSKSWPAVQSEILSLLGERP